MKLKIKKLHPNAVLPQYAKKGDAGLDLTCTEIEFDSNTHTYIYKTGLAVEIPEGYVGLLFPRSSLYKTILHLTNSVGVIDSGYRGEIMVRFINIFDPREKPETGFWQFPKEHYQVGDRIAQLILLPYPQLIIEEVEELTESERGEKGFGSSGK